VCSDDEFDFSDEDDSSERAELVCSCGEEMEEGDTCCIDCFNEMTFPD